MASEASIGERTLGGQLEVAGDLVLVPGPVEIDDGCSHTPPVVRLLGPESGNRQTYAYTSWWWIDS